MTSNERQKKIIRLLDKRRKDTMEHLSIEFHVSTDTISRDIATLNEDYPIKIVRGRNGGLSLNVQDCLTNDTAYAMLANSEFVVMLRQTKDIDSVVELYGLSEPQRKYLLLAQPGEGIIKMGNSLIPFNNPQPKDTKTYKLLTTKPGEME